MEFGWWWVGREKVDIPVYGAWAVAVVVATGDCGRTTRGGGATGPRVLACRSRLTGFRSASWSGIVVSLQVVYFGDVFALHASLHPASCCCASPALYPALQRSCIYRFSTRSSASPASIVASPHDGLAVRPMAAVIRLFDSYRFWPQPKHTPRYLRPRTFSPGCREHDYRKPGALGNPSTADAISLWVPA
jgi:hypothetical protein